MTLGSCNHCGKPDVKLHAGVDRAGRISMFGSECVRKYRRADAHDLVRDLARDLVEELVAKYPEHERGIRTLAEHDPSGPRYKYLRWGTKMLLAMEPTTEIAEVASLFDKYGAQLPKRDINQYPASEFTPLKVALERLSGRAAERETKVALKYRLPEPPESEVIYDDDRFEVRHIQNKAAAMVYGAETGAVCTTGREGGWCIRLGDKPHYEEYEAANAVFFFVTDKTRDPSDPLSLVAVTIVRDMNDKPVRTVFTDRNNKQVWPEGPDAKLRSFLGTQFEPVMTMVTGRAKMRPKGLLARVAADVASESDQEKAYGIAQRYRVGEDAEVGRFIKDKLTESKNLGSAAQEKLAVDQDPGVRANLAMRENLVPAVQEKLAGDVDWMVRRNLARSENLVPALQEKLAVDEDPGVRQSLAMRGNLMPAVQKKLAGDDNMYVRRNLAGHWNLMPALQEKLAGDDDEYVRRNLAQRENLVSAVQEKLAGDVEAGVRWYLAEREDLVPAVQEKLAGDDDVGVRANLAKHKNLTPAARAKLLLMGTKVP